MPVLTMADLGGYRCLDFAECSAAGEALAADYRSADPYPHVVLEDFLSPDVLRGVLEEFPDSAGHHHFDRAQERLKFQFRPDQCAGAMTRMLFAELNSRAFLAFLSGLTGIKGLIADPYHAGAGLHETRRGGHLSVHSDFPIHSIMRLERRLNLLVYLNEDWPEDYGGALELWDRGMARAHRRIVPSFGRAVVFSTERDTFHGHPDPLTCPEHRSRRSIATYYYTATVKAVPDLERTTEFRARPGTRDKADWSVMLANLKSDWLPPVVQRRLARPASEPAAEPASRTLTAPHFGASQ